MTVSEVVTLSVGEAAAAVGLTTYTLRWYEQEGLVEPVERDSAGRRRYTEADLGFLGLLTKLRRTGMSVADMRKFAQLIREGPHTVPDRLELLQRHRDGVLERIEALHQDLDAVNVKIDIYRAEACQEPRQGSQSR